MLKVICNVEQATIANQAGSPQHNSGQQKAANANQTGQEQAANANHTGSPQHNPVQPLFCQALRRLISLLRAHYSPVTNRDAPSDNLPAVAQLVGARSKSLAAFLGLAIQICDKLKISADDM